MICFVSARHGFLYEMTERQIKESRAPMDKLICVGAGKGTKQRKLEAIRKNRIDLFFDDNRKVVTFLRENGANAHSREALFEMLVVG